MLVVSDANPLDMLERNLGFVDMDITQNAILVIILTLLRSLMVFSVQISKRRSDHKMRCCGRKMKVHSLTKSDGTTNNPHDRIVAQCMKCREVINTIYDPRDW